jgi:hypothetical protein
MWQCSSFERYFFVLNKGIFDLWRSFSSKLSGVEPDVITRNIEIEKEKECDIHMLNLDIMN